MPAPTRIPDSLVALAHSQCQVVTRQQALACGLSPDGVRGLVSGGRWAQLATGVYLTDGRSFQRADWIQWAWAGILIAGPGSCLGLRAAAHLHGFDDESCPIHIWCPSSRSRPRRPRDAGLADRITFHGGDRPPQGSPPRTSVDHTVLDLCSCEVPRGQEPDNRLRVMEAIRVRIEKGVRLGGTSLESLSATLAGESRLHGAGRVQNVLNLLTCQDEQLHRALRPGERPIPTAPWWPVTTSPSITR